MGNVTAPSLANLFMGLLEKNILSKCSNKPLVWSRYIDDVFFIWTHSEEDLDDFLVFCNSYNSNIQLDPIPPSKNIPFLDVSVIIENGKLICGLYTKPTDSHLCLRWSSCHSIHKKENLPYTLALRIRRICTRLTDFEKHAKKLRSYLIARGYKLKNIKDSINKARKISRYDILNKNDQDWLEYIKDEDKNDKVVFSVTYNPALPNIHKIPNSLKPVLDSSERCKSVFKNGIIVGYRRGRSLTDMLVSGRMPKDLGTLSTQSQNKSLSSTDKDENDTCNICKRTFKNGKAQRIHEFRSHKDQDANSVAEKGFSSCKDKRCKTCKAGNFGKSFNSLSTGICYSINQEMNYKIKNVCYLLTCERCDDQYVGETKRQLNRLSAALTVTLG